MLILHVSQNEIVMPVSSQSMSGVFFISCEVIVFQIKMLIGLF